MTATEEITCCELWFSLWFRAKDGFKTAALQYRVKTKTQQHGIIRNGGTNSNFL